MTTTASEVYSDVVILYKLKIFQSWTFLIKIYNILKNNILTCSCWASVESWLLWCYASRSSLLHSGFRYTIELPLQPYKIQLYTFRVQGLTFFLPWIPDFVLIEWRLPFIIQRHMMGVTGTGTALLCLTLIYRFHRPRYYSLSKMGPN